MQLNSLCLGVCLNHHEPQRKKVEKLNSDRSKYSLIRNKFGTHWILRIDSFYDLFNDCQKRKDKVRKRRFFYAPKHMFVMKKVIVMGMV